MTHQTPPYHRRHNPPFSCCRPRTYGQLHCREIYEPAGGNSRESAHSLRYKTVETFVSLPLRPAVLAVDYLHYHGFRQIQRCRRPP
ncbi:hypothetical protein BC938DRAFT_470675 [Jimgerdemannia flammicorona]|uniref:Uncharacterized protein n=1 Tax=Jimgerdemannia flammicorona TaxID=994334 RepID=A0A433R028_9FUNG|nr:hypothetical protein BC938DRAFT_470675 [Jimgerdemannia flammicorona]